MGMHPRHAKLFARGLLLFAGLVAWPGCDDRPTGGAFSTGPLKRLDQPAPMELTRAVEEGSVQTVRGLLAQDADPNAKDPKGRTALHAFFSGRNWKLPAEMLELLLHKGARPGAQDVTGATPLHLAARRGRPEFVERLCKAGADPEAADNEGRTPLHEAASHERPQVAAVLLSKGARIDTVDHQGRSPLHLAAEHKDWATALVLLGAGADPLQQDDWGQKPIGWLAGACSEQLHKRTQADGPHPETDCTRIPALLSPTLHLAAAQGRQAVVAGLLERGAKPAERYGFTPAMGSPGTALHAAAAFGRVPVVDFLLRKGMIPDALDANGWTPLHLAVWKGHPEAVARLLAAGAEPARLTRSGQSALELADQAGHTEIGKLLRAAPRPAH